MANSDPNVIITPLTPEQIAEREAFDAGAYDRAVAAVDVDRKYAYQQESDPLFFGYQRGENTEQAWLDKVQEIKDRYPYPEQP